jgi:hypothetical protein
MLGMLSIFFHLASAQEKLDFMRGNPQQRELNRGVPKSWYPQHVSGITDTLELPLEDDFSTDKFADYYYYSCPSSGRQGHVFYNRLINGSPASGNVTYSHIRTFTTDSTLSPVGLTANDSLFLSFFNISSFYPGSPLQPDSSSWVYYPYNRIIGSTGLLDSSQTESFIIDSLIADSLYTVKLNHKDFIWLDRKVSVYRNQSFAISPPSLGVLTFDGTAWNGMPYNNFGNPNTQGSADTLTSKPINLNYNPVNGVYFSFFYQPKGLGNAPEFADSLLLEFRSPVKRWTRVWGKTGYNPGSDTSFVKVTLHITDTSWLKTGFQFRFRNYATLAGNCDHWHLDYVRIVPNASDTLINDIGFCRQPGNLLYPYTAVPYNQFLSGYMSSLSGQINQIRNLSSNDANLNYRFRITDFSGANTQSSFNVDNVVFYPSSVNSCESCARVLNPYNGLGYSFPAMNSCTEYRIKQWIEPLSLASNRGNDTIDVLQRFADYYSYDDGTPELAYGIENNPLTEVLYRIDLTNAATLQGLYLNFTPFTNDARQQEFSIVVKSNDAANNAPGDSVYEETGKIPLYTDRPDGFTQYLLSNPPALSAGTYYVGIRNFGNASLNIGFDANNNRQDALFIRFPGGSWYNTQFAGSLLMRPITASCPDGLPSSVGSFAAIPSASLVFPNPAHQEVVLPAGSVKVFHLSGTLLFEGRSDGSRPTDTSAWPEGAYIVKTLSSEGSMFVNKLLIQHR